MLTWKCGEYDNAQADLCLGNSLFYVTDEASCFGVPDGLVRMQGQVTGHPGMPAIIQIKWSVANAGLVSVAQRFFSETTVTNRTVKNEADQIHLIALKELPATMLSMDYTRVWYTDKRNTQQSLSASPSGSHSSHPPCRVA
ncbi:hypothetical protein WJX79_006814 [Trebouxia sp. C0005]